MISAAPEGYFEYLSTSLREGLTSLALLHLESVPLPSKGLYRLRITGADEATDGIVRTALFDGIRSRGCAFSVPSLGNHTISFESVAGASTGSLEKAGVRSFAATAVHDNFYSEVSLAIPPQSPSVSGSPEATPKPTLTATAAFTRRAAEA
jgi:hypothetical protein